MSITLGGLVSFLMREGGPRFDILPIENGQGMLHSLTDGPGAKSSTQGWQEVTGRPSGQDVEL